MSSVVKYAAGAVALGLSGVAAVAAFQLAGSPQSGTSPALRKGPPLMPRYAGVNLASGSFGTKALPGKYGKDYIYPGAKDAAPFLAASMTAVRVPFRWERIQPQFGGPLDPAELRRLDATVAAMNGFKLIILDLHNYGGYDREKIGTDSRPTSVLVSLWGTLAAHYRHDPRIAFGIMNEPIGIEADAWRQMAEATLAAIRATGARNLILIPGVRWTGAHSWVKGSPSNAEALSGLRDPANNMAFEMHQYVDGNSSGTGATCAAPAIAAARLAPATQWLRAQRARGFLAEFGAPGTPECLSSLDALVSALDDSSDVWLGWTYWAGGPRWNKYPLSIQPDGEGPKSQMRVLLAHLPRYK